MTRNRYCPTCRATTRWTDHGDHLTCAVCGPRVEKMRSAKWRAAGWSRPPRNGREWALLRDGTPEPQRRPQKGRGEIPPCVKCGHRRFNLKRNSRMSRGLQRYCMVCHAAYQRHYRQRPEVKAKRAAAERRRRASR